MSDTEKRYIVEAYVSLTIEEIENELYTLRFERSSLTITDEEVLLRIALAENAAALLNDQSIDRLYRARLAES